MPSSCLDTCWVDNMAVWWFRATCFHGLKYLCVNREVLKQNFIMRTEMKASSECLYPTDVFLISCGMGCKRITVSDIAYIEAMKDNCIIHMIDGKRYTQSCPMGDIEPELNPNMFKRIHRSFIVNIRYIDMYYYGHVVLVNGMEVHIGGIPQLEEIAGKTWKKEEELKGLKAELAALDRKIQLELAPPQEQDTAEKHETKNIETEQSIVGKQARSVCRL